MTDIKLVIKIPERIHYGIEKGITVNGSKASQILIDAVKNGTPLPKEHGRLLIISENTVKENMIGLDAFQQKFIGEVDLSNAIVGVIEADEENNMGRPIDDDVKQTLLDLLAKEPTMILSTAYVYAKNFVDYGEDITKAWTTAVQQASIIQEVRQKACVEAYDSFRKDYEARLKSDMVAMLTELQSEIEELENSHADGCVSKWRVEGVIQQKINSLKAESEDKE